MFHKVTVTWNPVTGCMHNCRYCWARKLVESRLRKITRKYKLGFLPHIHYYEFKRKFKPNALVFVSDMGDLFGYFIPKEWILRVIAHIKQFPRTTFLFLTKNPHRYLEFLDLFPENVILGATIETTDDKLYWKHDISFAPLPSERYKAMKEINGFRKMISIEPVLDFDPYVFDDWIRDIEPEFIYIGYDNYCNGLPEPPVMKVFELIDLVKYHTRVYTKTLTPCSYRKNKGAIPVAAFSPN